MTQLRQMVRNNMSNKLIALVIICLGWAQITFASLDVMDDDMEGFYGEAETQHFKEAVEGADALSSKERAYLSGIGSNRIEDRWYARLLIGRARFKLNSLQNESSGPAGNLTLAQNSLSDNLVQVLLAGGYVWEHWAMEAELLFTKPLEYMPRPTFSDTVFDDQVDATIRTYVLFFNLQYIIPRWFDFYPRRLQLHLDAGAGPVIKTTSATTFSDGEQTSSGSSRIFSIAGQLGVGARYQLSNNFLIDLAYRYMDFGKTKFGPVVVDEFNVIYLTSKQFRANGFYAGVTYQS